MEKREIKNKYTLEDIVYYVKYDKVYGQYTIGKGVVCQILVTRRGFYYKIAGVITEDADGFNESEVFVDFSGAKVRAMYLQQEKNKLSISCIEHMIDDNKENGWTISLYDIRKKLESN